MYQRIKYILRAYRYLNKIDPAEVEYLRSVLNKGDTVVDLGAHKGGYLYWMLKGVGKSGAVYAFEPQQILYDYLKRISKIMAYKNLVLEKKGLSSKAGSTSFYVPITRSGISPTARIDLLNDGEDHVKTEIELTTLDHFFLERDILPDLIKIDVEGHEAEVLKGGLNLLKACKPKIIMECENRHLKEGDILGIFKILYDLDYEGYFYENKIKKSLLQFEVEKYQKVSEGKYWESENYINNFIFE